MPRIKREVPDHKWVNPKDKAHRIALGAAHEAAKAGPPLTKPKLAVTNPAPVDSGLIGHPSPKLVLTNDDPIKVDRTPLPDIDWR